MARQLQVEIKINNYNIRTMYSLLCRNLQRLISFIAFVVRLARSCMLHTVSKLRDPFIPKQGQNVLRNEVIDKGGTQIARVSGHPSLCRSFAGSPDNLNKKSSQSAKYNLSQLFLNSPCIYICNDM